MLTAILLGLWLGYLPAYGLLFLAPVQFGRRLRKVLRPVIVTITLALCLLVGGVPLLALRQVNGHSLYWDYDLAWWIVDCSPAVALVLSICASSFLIAMRHRVCRETRPAHRAMRRCALFLSIASLPLAVLEIRLVLSVRSSGGWSTLLLAALAGLFALSAVLLYLDGMRGLPVTIPRAVTIGRRAALVCAVVVAISALGIMFLIPEL